MLKKVLCVLVLVMGSVQVFAHEGSDHGHAIYVSNVWGRATETATDISMNMRATPSSEMGGQMVMTMDGVSAAYLHITNMSADDLVLVGGRTNAANVVEVHEMLMQNDVMQMRPVEGGIVISAGETAILEQGGLHIMLLELQYPLLEGGAIPLYLTFNVLDEAGNVTDETLEIIVGVPLFLEKPEQTSIVATSELWIRPTLSADTLMTQGGGMAMPEGTQEAHTGMNMGAMAGMTESADISAMYGKFINISGTEDRLVAVRSNLSDLIEIHETSMQNDVMQMRPLEGGLLLPINTEVALAPGEIHMMLMNLNFPALDGEAVVLTLVFESGAEMVIGVPIYDRLLMMEAHP
jgi:copper(I)-binding protein